MAHYPGIKQRLSDARILWQNGRREGSLIQILIAVAATSRKRYARTMKNPYTSKPYTDRDAFCRFILDEMEIITGGIRYGVRFPFQGRNDVPLTEILYTHFRCPAVHEAEVTGMEFSPDGVRDGQRFAILKLSDPLGFPELWVETLASAVWLAPENDDQFSDDPRRPGAVATAMTMRICDSTSFYKPTH